MSDATVAAKTGKKWGEWFRILDKAGARKMPHRDVARLLYAKHKVPSWWCQMVTVEYERARGLRAVHQAAAGFVANASRTFDASASALYNAWTDARRRRRWLGEAKVTLSTANKNKSLRMVWGRGPQRVEVYFTPKSATRCVMTVQHNKLAGSKDVATKKEFWSAAFNKLTKALS